MDELRVEFFLKKEGVVINNLEVLARNWQDYFYRFSELNDTELTKYLQEDPFYIEGAICIWYYGLEVLTFREWDLIDQLLSYFVQSFHELLMNGNGNVSFFFPDQPLELKMVLQGGSVLLSLGDSSVSRISIASLFEAFFPVSKLFFQRLANCLDTDKYDNEMSLIDSLMTGSKKW